MIVSSKQEASSLTRHTYVSISGPLVGGIFLKEKTKEKDTWLPQSIIVAT